MRKCIGLRNNTISRDDSVNFVTVGELDNRGSITGGGSDFSVRHYVQTGCISHPAFYTMGTGSLYSDTKWFEHKVPSFCD
jgi:hypothetical protein